MNQDFAAQYGYWEEWHWWFRARQRIIESVLQRELSDTLSPSIISVGCGPAEGLKWLLPLAGTKGHLVGLDADPLQAPKSNMSINYTVGRVEAAPFATGAFDLVLALDILEHLDDDVSGLNEMARILKPGGLLLVTVPAFPSLWGVQDIVSHHRRRYTKRSLRTVFDAAPLSLSHIRLVAMFRINNLT